MTSALATMRVDYEQIRIKTIEDSTNPLLMKRRKKANNAVATPAAHWKMHACLPSHTNTGCEKEAIICRRVSRVAWIFLSFFFLSVLFSWQIVMFCKSVCFYYSTILTTHRSATAEGMLICVFTPLKRLWNLEKGRMGNWHILLPLLS